MATPHDPGTEPPGMKPPGTEAFRIDLPVHEVVAQRTDFGEALVPQRTLRSPDGRVIRELSLSADGACLLVDVMDEHSPRREYAISLEYLADFVALVHAARRREGQA